MGKFHKALNEFLELATTIAIIGGLILIGIIVFVQASVLPH